MAELTFKDEAIQTSGDLSGKEKGALSYTPVKTDLTQRGMDDYPGRRAALTPADVEADNEHFYGETAQ